MSLQLFENHIPALRFRCSGWTAFFAFVSVFGCAHASGSPSSAAPTGEETARAELPQLDAKKLVFSLRGEEEAFRRCFMRSITSRGHVSIRFFVGEGGAVDEAVVQRSTIAEPSVVDCLQKRLLAHQFEATTGPAVGRWTFVFRLGNPLDPAQRKAQLAAARKDTRPPMFIEPESPGKLDLGKVDEIVQVNYPLYAHCYRDSIRRTQDAGGVLRLRFSVAPSGLVDHVEDAGSVLPDPFALDCIAEAFYAMRFPAPVGGSTTLQYRLDLE